MMKRVRSPKGLAWLLLSVWVLVLAACGGGANHKGTELVVSGVAPAAPVLSGNDAIFAMTVRNAGSSDAGSVQIVNVTGGQMALVSITCSASGGASCPGQPSALMTIPTLPAGGVLQFEVTARVLTGATGSITDTMTISSADDINKDTNSVSVTGSAYSLSNNLVVTGSGPGGSVTGGQSIVFEMAVSNQGPDAAGSFTIVDTPGNSLTPTGITCTATGGAVCPTPAFVMNVDSLPAGATLTFEVTATVAAGLNGTAINTMAVSIQNDANRADNSATATATAVTPISGLFVTGTGPAGNVSGGSTAVFTMNVGNAGPSASSGATILDIVGSNLSLLGISCTAAGGAVCPAVLGPSMVVDPIPANGSLTFLASARVAPGTNGAITNTMSVTATNDSDRSDNSATAVGSAVTSRAALAVSGSGPAGTVAGGETAVFVMTLGNSGPDTASSVYVTNLVSGNLALVGITCTASGGVSCPANLGVVTNIGDLPVGGQLVFNVSALVATGANGAISNTMQAYASNDGNPQGNTAIGVGQAFTARSSLTVTGVGPTLVPSGGSTDFLMTVSNAGPQQADTVRLLDTGSGNLTLTSITCSAATGGAVCPANPGLITDVSNLPVGGTLTFDIGATVTPGTQGLIANTMTATVTSGTPSQTTGLAVGNAYADNVNLTLIAEPLGPMLQGQPVSYTMLVANDGPGTALNVAITNTLVNATLDPNTAITCTAARNAVCPTTLGASMVAPSIPAHAALTFTIPVIVGSDPSKAFITVTETMTAVAAGDTNAADNSASSRLIAVP